MPLPGLPSLGAVLDALLFCCLYICRLSVMDFQQTFVNNVSLDQEFYVVRSKFC